MSDFALRSALTMVLSIGLVCVVLRLDFHQAPVREIELPVAKALCRYQELQKWWR